MKFVRDCMILTQSICERLCQVTRRPGGEEAEHMCSILIASSAVSSPLSVHGRASVRYTYSPYISWLNLVTQHCIRRKYTLWHHTVKVLNKTKPGKRWSWIFMSVEVPSSHNLTFVILISSFSWSSSIFLLWLHEMQLQTSTQSHLNTLSHFKELQ